MKLRYSLSEIDVTCRKAARGAGYSWGLAEEAGKVARWLAAYNLNGPETLATILQQTDSHCAEFTPQLQNGLWTNENQAICPIIAGTILSDRGHHLAAGQSFTFRSMLQPIALLPQLGRLAETDNLSLNLSWGDEQIFINADGIKWDQRQSNSSLAEEVVCEPTGEFIAQQHPEPVSRAVDATQWKTLNAFAHRTYAPATQASRLSGAGAGLQDND